MAHLIETSRKVAHTHEVLTDIEGLMSIMKDAETGQRGFLVVGEEDYLVPYNTARAAWRGAFARLHALTEEDPTQRHRVDRLEPLLADKFKELQRTINLRQEQKGDKGFQEALAVVKSNEGKDLMDQARKIAGEMREHGRPAPDGTRRGGQGQRPGDANRHRSVRGPRPGPCGRVRLPSLAFHHQPRAGGGRPARLRQRRDPGEHDPAGRRRPGAGGRRLRRPWPPWTR